MNRFDQYSILYGALRSLVVLTFVGSLALVAGAQQVNPDMQVSSAAVKTVKPAEPANPGTQILERFREARIGMDADTLRDAWGKPKIEDATGYIYELSDNETAQIWIDPEEKVKAIAMMFEDGVGAPSGSEVFGSGVQIAVQENGSMYHMQRYPDLGYWISYYKGSGNKGLVTLTVHKL
jgi:hypothetical protein